MVRCRPIAALVAGCAVLFAALPALALSPGETPYIYGMHDEPDPNLFLRDGCGRGWITMLRYIGDDGTCDEAMDFSSWTDQGFGIIMRLDYGTPAQPPYESQWDGYAATFADCVRKSSNVEVWVVGNEPNIPWGHPENRSFSGQEYGEIYKRTLAAVNALPGGDEHVVLFAAMAPWAAIAPWGDWDDGMSAAIDHAGTIDGVAIHAYTRNNFSVAAITSDEWFPGRENKWHHHFRLYRDVTGMLAGKNIYDIPLFITESGNACDPPCDPYPDQDIGYFYAMYEEIDNWNQANPRQRIRAVTPYRWTQNDDGSGRDFCIGCADPLKQDIARAVDQGWTWDAAACTNQCAPSCDGRVCGPDGCGGSCGSCGAGSSCNGIGQCEAVVVDEGADTFAPPADTQSADTVSFDTTTTPSDIVGPPTTSQPDVPTTTSPDATTQSAEDDTRLIADSCGCTQRPVPARPLPWLLALASVCLIARRL